MVDTLVARLPPDFQRRLYVEPFLGAASLYLATEPRQAFLSDVNRHLVDCYAQVQKNPDAVARCLAAHRRHHGLPHYYRSRLIYNKEESSPARAARFIYLNRTGFNGIFRVNQAGEYNVPYGYKSKAPIPAREHLTAVATLLNRATLSAACFREALNSCPRRSFIYLDPPYPPLNGTAYFTHYTADRFGPEDQEALAELVHKLHNRGMLFLMSNADTRAMRKLYSRFQLETVPVTRFVTSGAVKHKVRELLIRNY
jgi:DNA adenine methylase